ncbi:glutamine synthetase family protein [Thioclava sp.]|uniref:glutamine synthetase family protein n=1 Tax=Thioclava sp. TaxID=1933450 RepID=UPI003AA97D15
MDDHPQIKTLILAAPDVNGIMRGKSVLATQLDKVIDGQVCMALSTPTVDIWGDEIEGCSEVAETGDCDVALKPTGRMPIPSVLASGCAILPCDFWMEDGTPIRTGCRQALAASLGRIKALGLRPVVALELEFYLYDPDCDGLEHPLSPLTGQRLSGREAAQINDLEHFADFLSAVRKNCAAADISVTAINSENGTGMFEINLNHSEDVLRAVDDTVFLRRLIRDTAQRHGLGATFMAKPFPNLDGCGMHIHFSILDEAGKNIFDNGGPEGTAALAHAAAGLLQHADEMQLIMAPHLNSYRRAQPNSYAPVNLVWGYDNRSVPIRIPGGDPKARRIEHRMAGADANPYLVTLAVLEAAIQGIEIKCDPVPPVEGACYDQGYPTVVSNLRDALRLFTNSKWTFKLMPALFHEAFINCKRQELALFEAQVTVLEVETYRDR